MKAFFLAAESPDPPHGGGPLRSACIQEWLRRRGEVHTLALEPLLPFHSTSPAARISRNVKRALRGIPPLVDRYTDPCVEAALEDALRHGPFDVAVLEHLWTAPWVDRVRPHCSTVILNLHNREAEFCRAMGGPLAGWFARCAGRWEHRLLPKFDQVWDPISAPTGLPLLPMPTGERTFDLVFSGTLAYPPNRQALDWLAAEIWPAVVSARPQTKLLIVGKNPEAVPTRLATDPLTKITGPVDDALAWLGRARIALSPLRRGAGVSVKIAEAWRAGCAVVSTPVGARGYHAPEAMVLESSASGLIRVILELLADPARGQRLAVAGRQHFEEHYSWPAVFARLDQRLAEVVTA